MGWVVAMGIAGLTLLGLHLSGRCSRLALEIGAAVLLAGIAGYGWQGSPDMPGRPVNPDSRSATGTRAFALVPQS